MRTIYSQMAGACPVQGRLLTVRYSVRHGWGELAGPVNMGTLFPAATDGSYREPYRRFRSTGEGRWYRFVSLCVYGFFAAGATLLVAFGLAVMPPITAVPHLFVNSL